MARGLLRGGRRVEARVRVDIRPRSPPPPDGRRAPYWPGCSFRAVRPSFSGRQSASAAPESTTMRRLPFLLLAVLSGCGDSAAPTYGVSHDDGNRIECRFAGADQFERSCSFEREGEGGAILVIRKPDGGFRRLRIVTDGRGVVAADGAEPAHVTVLDGNQIEVEIGGDHFRLPANVRR